MKHLLLLLLLLLFLFLFPALVFAQPKITDITWKGKNNEYIEISKKNATLKIGQHSKSFEVVKYVKNSYLILSSEHISGTIEQKYDIVRFTEDTLILAPTGKDVFRLSKANENNQYIFVNKKYLISVTINH